jgi:hypothetical protein
LVFPTDICSDDDKIVDNVLDIAKFSDLHVLCDRDVWFLVLLFGLILSSQDFSGGRLLVDVALHKYACLLFRI